MCGQAGSQTRFELAGIDEADNLFKAVAHGRWLYAH
jgi:hypothetical protein